MTGGRLHAGSNPCDAPAGLEALAAELRRLAREEAQEAVRQALRDLPGSRPKFTTLARAARLLGLGVSTLRRRARKAGVYRQPGGTYLLAELEAAAAGQAVAPPPVAQLAAARARAEEKAKKAAESLRGRP